MAGITLPPNINVLAQRVIAMPDYLNFYLGQVSKAANLLGGAGGWADTQVANEYAVINSAASNDPYKQCMQAGTLVLCVEILRTSRTASKRCTHLWPPGRLRSVGSAG